MNKLIITLDSKGIYSDYNDAHSYIMERVIEKLNKNE